MREDREEKLLFFVREIRSDQVVFPCAFAAVLRDLRG
jgi:hypothetical protein